MAVKGNLGENLGMYKYGHSERIYSVVTGADAEKH